jgi:hypothetical protein
MTTHRTALESAALIAEILGGIAVVVSVVYLAAQISDNTRMLRSQSHYNALDALQRPFEMMLESDDLSEHLVRCRDTPRTVSEAVWSRCLTYYFMQANGWEYTYYQELEGALPPSLWPGVEGYMAGQARTNPGWVRFWEETADGFGEPFRSHIEERIQQNPAYGPSNG